MKILIVDDSNFPQKIGSNLINKFLDNPDIYFASDGEKGFKGYKERLPDYTLIDLLMPNLNGKELIKLIKEFDSNAKIFVISADVQKSVKEEMGKLGIISFINKPFNDKNAKFVCSTIRKYENEQ